MKIEEARKLAYGAKVRCPADRGQPGYLGTVVDRNCAHAQESSNIHGVKYIWVLVRGPGGGSATWPSNRLS